MAKRGPKSGFNEKVKEAFVRLTKEGKTLVEVADVLGVTSRTLTNWMGKHQDLFLAVRESRQMADELVEASLYQRALGYSHPETKFFCHEGCIISEDTVKHYPPDTQAAQFWLRNRQPERWKEKTEGDVNVNTNLQINNLTDDQLDAKISAMLAKVRKEPEE